MCGIAGLCGFGRRSRENMERMKDRMIFRGPDAGGTWLSEDGEVCLGHRRLSILDLSPAGSQPMVSHSGRSVMVYNGEIYNYKELRQALVRDGVCTAFRGTGDSEVLLEAIEAWGMEKTLSLAKGMFALAVYDTKERTLSLARDRIGEKPLYYGFVRSGEDSRRKAFAFASDIGCFRALEGFDNPVCTDVLDIYFTHGYIPAPYTIYRDIHKLLPGTILTIRAPFEEACIRTSVYWSIRKIAESGMRSPFTGSREEAADELERLLRASIRGQMVADVPVGAFLSGGIDSSAVVSLMQQESAVPVRTFTIGMAEKGYNEAVFAGKIAEHLSTDHTELYIREQDAKEVIPLLPHMFSEPFADISQIPTYLVSKLARQHVTVSLSGDAGDELFCGYTDYLSVAGIWNRIRRIPAALRSALSGAVLHSPLSRKESFRVRATLLRAKSPEEVYRLSFETDPLTPRIALNHPGLPYAYTETSGDTLGEAARDVMLMDLQMYHPDDILAKVDRTAMAVSLETRIPLLDRDVVRFAASLPLHYLTDGTTGKLVLRDVLSRYVPRDLWERPKQGFTIPLEQWLKEPGLRAWAEDLTDPAKLRAEGYLDADVVEKMWRGFTGRGIWRKQIWYVLMFEAWLRTEYRGA